MRTLFLLLIGFCTCSASWCQQSGCTTAGQTPATAFPVCGTDVFIQTSVPSCSNNTVPVYCSGDNITYEDLNPYWYKFTCFQSGTLGFLIEPNNQNDDYDWQLYDITGKNINAVYTDRSLIVAHNWSGESGNTGASSAGNSLYVCATVPDQPTRPLFTQMPNLIEGHEYLLMVSHFSGDNQSGYKLSFGGGTASITDPKEPELGSASASCDATEIHIKLNKNMKCASLSPDGSDFSISAGTIISAFPANCSGFDMDSLVLTLSTPLPPGNYTVTAKNGTDGNTLVDDCDRTIPVGDNLSFTIVPLQPTPLDSLVPVKCAPSVLQLHFSKPVRCNSIAANGSDFNISGTSPVIITGAYGESCSNGVSSVINIQLAGPIYTAGNFQIQLKQGDDGSTIIDECGQQTPAGSTLLFSTKDTVSANFQYNITMGCKRDTIRYSHNSNNGTNQWQWVFDNVNGSTASSAIKTYPATGNFNTTLIVSNGFCSDTSSTTIILDNEVTADFEVPAIICPEDSITVLNKSSGPIDSWSWVFGNNTTSNLQTPRAVKYALTGIERYYTIGLTVHSPVGCSETITRDIRVLGSCYIAVPSAFTPNNDGLNDYLYPLNALKADKLRFRVFNRWGQLVFSTTDWMTKWDGTVSGVPQAAGVYVWTLEFIHPDTGKKTEMKGTTMLIR